MSGPSDIADPPDLGGPPPAGGRLWMRLLQIVLAGAALWATLTLAFSTGLFLDFIKRGAPRPFLDLVINYAKAYAPWAMFGPLVFHLSRHHALRRSSIPISVLQSLALILGIFIVYASYFGMLGLAEGNDPIDTILAYNVLAWYWDVYLFLCVYFVGRLSGGRVLRAAAMANAQRARSDALALEASVAQLEAKNLRHRFSSHFVMNALSNILGLVRAGARAQAENAILVLSDILKRLPRDETGSGDSTLGEELDFVAAYLEFQRIRYPEIDFEIEAPAETKRLRFPPQSLQPLVENMFKHGLGPDGGLKIRIAAWEEDGRLRLDLQNSIHEEAPPPGPDGEGLGLVRARLEMAFADDHRLDRRAQAESYRVEIETPAERAP